MKAPDPVPPGPDEDWLRLKDVFEGARALPADSRPAYLAAACHDSPALRHEVEQLLASHERARTFLEQPVMLFDDKADNIGTNHLPRVPDRIGRYRITATLGEGGMGEVYRAHDARLGRDVAIKILPRRLVAEPERLARFEREARMLASLNHPHVGAIYGVEDSQGVPALVLELVEGVTLAELIGGGVGLPRDQALPVARQIADALEAAHEKGIVHRDLKPANIKVTPDGNVKVLDFGLAKVLRGDGSAPDLPDPERTHEGMILGTAAYMSPEQARGHPVDKRTDVFAFGAILYEMLAGHRAFPGETVSDTLAAVIRAEPDWGRLPADTPAGIRRLLRRCLQKDCSRRLQSAGDARIEIDDAQSEPRMDAPALSSARPRGDPLAWIAVAVVTLIAAVAVAWNFRPGPSLPEMRLDITTPPTTDPMSLAISPDGQQIVFVATPDGRPQLWLRSLNSTARPITGTDDASFPFWSPDSRSVGFFAEGKLKRVDLDGGRVQTLADAIARGGTWSPDGVILFAPTTAGQLFRVPASGGAAVALPTFEEPQSAGTFPHFLPGGRQFLFYKPIGSEDTRGIYIGSLDSPVIKRLIAADTAGVYLPPGWLLFMRQGTLMAQGFDPAREELRGDPMTIADRVGFDSSLKAGAFSVSSAGLVMYRTAGRDRRQLTWFDRSGNALGTVGAPDESDLIAPELSPDGRRVMVQRTVQGNTDIWLLDGARTTRFTSDADIDRLPIWSPDGTRILFGSTRKGARDLYQKHSNGDDIEEPLLESLMDKAPNSWSPDGHFVLYTNLDPKAGADLWVLPLDQDRKPSVFLSTRFDERASQFSPDGRWVAYQSNESGPFQIYVRAFPGPGGQSQVSTAGGIQTRWRRDGKELYYIAPDGKLMAVPITAKGATLDAGIPMALFQTRIWGGGTNAFNRQQYDVAPDGRFLISVTTEDATSAPITLLLNWKAMP